MFEFFRSGTEPTEYVQESISESIYAEEGEESEELF
jgi:hypothetical protein